MLTPRFALAQTAVGVSISVWIPHLNASRDDADYVLVQHNTRGVDSISIKEHESDGSGSDSDDEFGLRVSGMGQNGGAFTELRFSAGPYFLRLVFPPGCVLVDDEADDTIEESGRGEAVKRRHKVSYDALERCIKIDLPKASPGKDFGDLDLLTRLAPRVTDVMKIGNSSSISAGTSTGVRIEPVASLHGHSAAHETSALSAEVDEVEHRLAKLESEEKHKADGCGSTFDDEYDDSFVDNVSQGSVQALDVGEPSHSFALGLSNGVSASTVLRAPPVISNTAELVGQISYGFNERHSRYFADIRELELLAEIFDNPDPEHLTHHARRQLRIAREVADYSENGADAIGLDFVNDESIRACIEFKPAFSQGSRVEAPLTQLDRTFPDPPSLPSALVCGPQQFMFMPPTSGSAPQLKVESRGLQFGGGNLNPATLVHVEPPQHQAKQLTDSTAVAAGQFQFGQVPSNKNSLKPFEFGLSKQPVSTAGHGTKTAQSATIRNMPQWRWTDREKDLLRTLPNRDLLPVPDSRLINIWCVLVDLLFSWAYNHRTTLGENTCESAWTIVKLSPAMSWLDTQWIKEDEGQRLNRSAKVSALTRGIRSTLLASCERSLCYPLYRHWELCLACIGDVSTLLQGGRKVVLRALLDLKDILEKSETQFHLTRLFVDDYCGFVQSDICPGKYFADSAQVVKLLSGRPGSDELKVDVRWNLSSIEADALHRVAEGWNAPA